MVRTCIEWVNFKECSELFYDKHFLLRLKRKFIRAVCNQPYCMEVKHGA